MRAGPQSQAPNHAHRLERTRKNETRAPSTGSNPTSRPSEVLRVPCYVRVEHLAPFSPDAMRRALVNWGHAATPCYPTLSRLASRLASNWRGQDASFRLLQPTYDTSTRRPFDFRARGISPRRPPSSSLAAQQPTGGGPPRPRSSLRGARSSFDDRTPAGTRLTARLQLRPFRTRALSLCLSAGERRAPIPFSGRRHLAAACWAADEADERPLTPPVAPRAAHRNFLRSRCEEPEPLPPLPRQGERLSRSEAPFIDGLLPRTRFRDALLVWEPATGLAALPPTIRLPALCHLRGAHAPRG